MPDDGLALLLLTFEKLGHQLVVLLYVLVLVGDRRPGCRHLVLLCVQLPDLIVDARVIRLHSAPSSLQAIRLARLTLHGLARLSRHVGLLHAHGELSCGLLVHWVAGRWLPAVLSCEVGRRSALVMVINVLA